jgi:hypothetical protein
VFKSERIAGTGLVGAVPDSAELVTGLVGATPVVCELIVGEVGIVVLPPRIVLPAPSIVSFGGVIFGKVRSGNGVSRRGC